MYLGPAAGGKFWGSGDPGYSPPPCFSRIWNKGGITGAGRQAGKFWRFGDVWRIKGRAHCLSGSFFFWTKKKKDQNFSNLCSSELSRKFFSYLAVLKYPWVLPIYEVSARNSFSRWSYIDFCDFSDARSHRKKMSSPFKMMIWSRLLIEVNVGGVSD